MPAPRMDATPHAAALDAAALAALAGQLQAWGQALGFSQIGIADIDLATAEPGLLAWLAAGHHGGMDYMAVHGLKRARPAELHPGTLRVVTARMDYRPGTEAIALDAEPAAASADDWRDREFKRIDDPGAAVISVYARGRDYHKVMRQRLARLAEQLALAAGAHGHRVFCDSAPVLEAELASRSGLGWRGKHTLILSREAGSMFFLGEIFVTLPLPLTLPVQAHCGSCSACLQACPTGAITAPYRLDARRCISYLTIEHDGAIPMGLRAALGNRIYGCDDCQLACPWNKFAQVSTLPDFEVREGLDSARLLELWAWDEAEFLRRTEGSAIRRIGHRRWRRNLAVALGNALRHPASLPAERAVVRATLAAAQAGSLDPLVAEHVAWALAGPGA
jgi:epoxyqueuosine reductase